MRFSTQFLCWTFAGLCWVGGWVEAETPQLAAEKSVYESGELIQMELMHFAPSQAQGSVLIFYTPNDRAFPQTQPTRVSVSGAARHGDLVAFSAPVVERNALYRLVVMTETTAGWQQARVDLGIVNPARSGSLSVFAAGGREVFLEGETMEVDVVLKAARRVEPTMLELRAQEFVEVSAGQWIAVGAPLTLASCDLEAAAETSQMIRFALRTGLLKPMRYELQAVAPSVGLVSNGWTMDIVGAEAPTHFPIFERDDLLARLAIGQMPKGGSITKMVDSLRAASVNLYVEPRAGLSLTAPWPKRVREDSGFEDVTEKFAQNRALKKILSSDWRLPSEELRIVPPLAQSFDESLLLARIGWEEEPTRPNPLAREDLARLGDVLLELEEGDENFARIEGRGASLQVQRSGAVRYLLVTPEKAPQRVKIRFHEPRWEVYDLATRRLSKDAGVFETELRGLRPCVFAVMPRAIERLEVTSVASLGAFGVVALDRDGKPIDGAVPLELVVRDPMGEVRARRFREAGREESLKIAMNDRAGEWTVTATELLSGRWVQAVFAVPLARDVPLPAAASRAELGLPIVAVPNFAEVIADRRDFALRRLVMDSGTPVLLFERGKTRHGRASENPFPAAEAAPSASKRGLR